MKHDDLIRDLELYCAAVGLKASTVCVRAVNDSRYVARHQRRLDALERDAEKIREYMRAHPPESPKDGAGQ